MRCLGIVVLVGCAAVPPPATPPPAATATSHAVLLAIPDETMVFTVALRGVTLARVQTAVGHLGEVDAHRAVIVKSRGHRLNVDMISSFGRNDMLIIQYTGSTANTR